MSDAPPRDGRTAFRRSYDCRREIPVETVHQVLIQKTSENFAAAFHQQAQDAFCGQPPKQPTQRYPRAGERPNLSAGMEQCLPPVGARGVGAGDDAASAPDDPRAERSPQSGINHYAPWF